MVKWLVILGITIGLFGLSYYYKTEKEKLEVKLEALQNENENLKRDLLSCQESMSSCERVKVDLFEAIQKHKSLVKSYQERIDKVAKERIIVNSDACEDISNALIEFRNRQLQYDNKPEERTGKN